VVGLVALISLLPYFIFEATDDRAVREKILNGKGLILATKKGAVA
jgi:hypothetical protein